MAKIRWTNLALDDLRAIHDYISQDSPKYADRLMDKIIERVDVLEQHPKINVSSTAIHWLPVFYLPFRLLN